MPYRGLFLSFIAGFFLLTTASSQQKSAFDSLTGRADAYFSQKKYDSALISYKAAIKLYSTHKPDEYEILQSAAIMLNTGMCYRNLKDYANAHLFYTHSLKQSRALHSSVDLQAAFVELNNLHRQIRNEDIPFQYPQVPATEEMPMYFPVTKVEIVSKDSLRLNIRAGKLDGITDSVIKCGIISNYDDKDPKRPFGLVNCYIRNLQDNFCVAMASNDSSLMVKNGDLVEIKIRVPLHWRKLDFGYPSSLAIGFRNNYKQPIIDSRYLYYYADSLTNKDLTSVLKYEVDEIASTLGEDTLHGEYANVRGEKGIFSGQNVMAALAHTLPEHLRLFVSFVSSYPRKYMGHDYKFSEVYATWVISNTPLAKKDVAPFLIHQPNQASRQRMAANLSDDIRKEELISAWFNDGMLMANADNYDSATMMATLIQDGAIALMDQRNLGWSDYLNGFIRKKLGEYKQADSLFRIALNRFKQSGNREGISWAENAMKNLDKSREVSVHVQSGHLFPYLIAPSPNSRYLATGGNYDRFIRIWDVTLSREINSFIAHSDGINSLHFSPNGKYLISSSDDSTIKIWNAYDYSLLKTFKRPKPENDVIFTPDSKKLVAGGRDSLVKILDADNGAVIQVFKKHRGAVTTVQFMPNNEDYLFSAGTDSMVYKWDVPGGKWDHWYKCKGRIINFNISNDGSYMYTVSTDTLIKVWTLNNNKFYFSVKPNYSISGNTDFALPSFTPDSKYIAFALKDDTLDVIKLATLKERVYPFSKPGEQGSFAPGLYDVSFSNDGNYLAGRYNNGGPLRIFNFSSWDFDNRPTINYKDIKNYFSLPVEVQFSKDDNSLAIVHDGISSIDLRTGKTSFLYYGALGFQNSYILTNNENIGLYTDTQNAYLKFYDHVNKQTVLKIHLPDITEELTRFELSANNQFVFLGGNNNTIAGFELPAGKMLFSDKYVFGKEKGFTSIRFDSLHNRLFVTGKSDEVIVLDAKNGKILTRIMADGPQTIEASDNAVFITCAKSRVFKYDAATLKLLKKITVSQSGAECYGSALSSNYRYLVVQVDDKLVTIDTRTDKVLYEKKDHDYENGTMSISHDNRLLATGGFDCKVNLYDIATGNRIASIYTPREKEFMLVNESNNYLAPKNTLEAVNFRFNGNSYGFEQFDSRFNRPDLLLQSIGRADSALIGNYRAAFRKRMAKLGINENTLGNDVHLPAVRLKDKYTIKPATALDEYEITAECYDAKYPLQSVQVLVNNNPLFPGSGQPIQGNTFKKDVSIRVPLSVGTNMVKVYCTNIRGAVSLSESIEINSSNKPASLPKTYFIGIAVSNYKDSSMNLKFAAKDVRDLAASFKKLYKQYEADTLIDRQATRDNILALREKLMKTTVNDKVIISVNGHGLLDDSLDFYYGTYDIDFRNPSSHGLKYEELEALLDGIPARKKLLLIDACHSGALDKEELLTQQKSMTVTPADTTEKAGAVTGFASRGIILKNAKRAADANSSYDMMQNLFTDLSTGNGAVIISAAGGMEYAFESDKWNNGVFTYCIRKGLEEEMADKDGGNGDKYVDIAELKNYVSRKVSELTKGKQKPVSRRENIEFNWIVW